MEMGEENFEMSEPKAQGEKYAFYLTTSQARLFECVRELICVLSVEMMDDHTALVVIKNEYDADEVWHYICSELREEAEYVELDEIWEKVIWLL